MGHIIIHTLVDTVKILPFLFLTYLLMEFIEHKAGNKTTEIVAKAGRVGPLVGGLLGALPQCGFSAAASGFYSGKIITVGTLLAIFLSTSDEMLPVMLSNNVDILRILKIIGIKVLIGILVGFAVDLVMRLVRGRKAATQKNIEKLNSMEHDHAHCHCHSGKGIFVSALLHTLQIIIFVLIISLTINVIIHHVGTEKLAAVIQNSPVITNIISGAIGLIPNCAVSVVITKLYLDGLITAGAMFSGLLTGAGVGLLILFRANKNMKENICILIALFVIGTFFGTLIDLTGLAGVLGL